MTLEHPYRILVTHAGARYANISLARVREGNPIWLRDARIQKILFSVRAPIPRHASVPACMPPRPEGEPTCIYDQELARVYDALDQLAEAPANEEL